MLSPASSVASQPLQSGDRVVTFSDRLSSSAIRQLRKRSDHPSGACAMAKRLMAESKDSDDANWLVAEFFIHRLGSSPSTFFSSSSRHWVSGF